MFATSNYIKKNLKRIDEFLSPFTILSYDENAAKYYGKIRSQLEKQGNIIDSLDMLIAAHALSNKLILVTNNTKEFHGIKSLQVENWLAGPDTEQSPLSLRGKI